MGKKFCISLLVGFVCAIWPQKMQAQPGSGEQPKIGAVRGVVLEAGTSTPLEYANVALFRQQDSSLVSGALTDSLGRFRIERLAYGTYYLKVVYIGYRETWKHNIVLTAEKPELILESVFVAKSDLLLEELEVKGDRDVIEYNLDKKVFNVEKDLTSVGGSGLDVMKNIPSVTVDVDGNVSLRGSTNVNVLVDGKPSSLSPTQILEQIPASMIESIEVITNPSAKYDPDGMTGILNIVTKKSRDPGYNGNIHLTAGTRHKYTGTVTMNYKTGKFNFFGSYDYRYMQTIGSGDVDRSLTRNDTISRLQQRSDRLDKRQSHTGKLGADIYFDARHTLTLSGTYRTGPARNREDILYNNYDYLNQLSEHFERYNTTRGTHHNYDLAANFRKTYKTKGREWTADAMYSSNERNQNLFAHQVYTFSDYQTAYSSLWQRNRNLENNGILTLQTDYVHPTEKAGRFETGLKTIVRTVGSELRFENYDEPADQWQNDIRYSNSFQYTEQVYSGYFIYGNQYKKLRYQGGVRAEKTFTESHQVTTDERFLNNYFNFFPSAHLKYELSEGSELMLSYSRRINRPSVWSLNPFPEYTDPMNLRFGNPRLLPEYVDAYELGYGKYWKNVSMNVTAFHRQTDNVILFYRTIDSLGVSRMTRFNLAKSRASGADLVFVLSPYNWWRLTLSVSAYHYQQDGRAEEGIAGVERFMWNAKFNSGMTLPKGFDIQVSGQYESVEYMAQGKILPRYMVDLALKKDVLKNQGSITLRISDIFDTRRFHIQTTDPAFFVDSRFKRETRVLYLGFSYKINGGNNRREKRNTDFSPGGGADFEMN